MAESETTVEATITGRVQGVSFRAWVKEQADILGLSGEVRNEPDGAVYAVVSGRTDKVAAMLELLARGPPAATVAHIDTKTVASDRRLSGFRITG